jgi:hypothetical protein
MPRRLQAITLLLLLVLSPIAGWSCGLHCVAMTPHVTASQQHACARASACCPKTPTLCSRAPGSDSGAFLVAGTAASPDAIALVVLDVGLVAPLQSSGLISANSSPPGSWHNAGPIPLRI